jgi:hypothetical protein
VDGETSSADSQALLRYAEIGLRIDTQTEIDAARLRSVLDEFAATCTEYRLGIDGRLADGLLEIAWRNRQHDMWVRRIAQQFIDADAGAVQASTPNAAVLSMAVGAGTSLAALLQAVLANLPPEIAAQVQALLDAGDVQDALVVMGVLPADAVASAEGSDDGIYAGVLEPGSADTLDGSGSASNTGEAQAFLQWASNLLNSAGAGISTGQVDVGKALDALGELKDLVIGDNPLPFAIAGGVATSATSAAGDLESSSNCDLAKLQAAQATQEFTQNQSGDTGRRLAQAYAALIAACGPGAMASTALYTAGGTSLIGPPIGIDKGGFDSAANNHNGLGGGDQDQTAGWLSQSGDGSDSDVSRLDLSSTDASAAGAMDSATGGTGAGGIAAAYPDGAKPPKGTAEGDAWRYQRYQDRGGLLSFDDWYSLSRGGRSGGASHQAIQQEIVDQFRSDFPNAQGAQKEYAVLGSGRWADAFWPTGPNDKPVYHQIGGLNPQRGDPIARERQAIADIRSVVGDNADIYFWNRDDPSAPPLINPDKQPGWYPPSMGD